jgi:hypothetical protein
MKEKKTDFLIGTGIEKGDGQLDSSKSPALPRYDKEQMTNPEPNRKVFTL